MKYVVFLSVHVLLSSVMLQAQKAASSPPQIFALVVGVAHYSDSRIPNLKYADKDALSFAEYLKTPFAGSVPDRNIVLLTNEKANRSTILRELVQLISRSSKEDMLIFYFSGHGKNDMLENSGYLLSYDADNDNEAGTAISMDELKSKIDRSPAKLKVSYVDACHAGLFTGGKGNANDNGEIMQAYIQSLTNAADGNVSFLASSSRQQSLEDDKLEHGVFTYYLIKGLQGEADKEQKGGEGYDDGIVTINEIETYLSNKIQLATKYKQKPSVVGVYDDDFPLSILRTSLKLDQEIAKRPAKKASGTGATPVSVPQPVKIPEDVRLTADKTYTGGTCYGLYEFINQLKEPVILYKMKGWFNAEPASVLITPGRPAVTGRLWAGLASDAQDCNKVYDYLFSFKTIKEGAAPRYAYIKVAVEAGKKKSYVLDEQTLYFSDKEFDY